MNFFKHANKNNTIVFLAEADYHIRNAALVVRYLKSFNVDCYVLESCTKERALSIAEQKNYKDIKIQHVDNFEMIFSLPFFENIQIAVTYSFGSSKTRDLLQNLSYLGITTACVVEGVWDYLKLILGVNQLTPYRNCEYTFLSGTADTLYYEDRLDRCYIGGLASVRKLLSENVSFPEIPLAVINVNFSYGQAEYGRNLFLNSAVEGCQKAGINYVITQHPHDFSVLRFKYNVSQKTMYQLIEEGSIFISRFANGIFESLALGKPVIYHNPHNEKAINFLDPMGAFASSFDSDSLSDALNQELNAIKNNVNFRKRAKKFLQYHTNIFSIHPPEHNIGNGLIEIINRKHNLLGYCSNHNSTNLKHNLNDEKIKHSDHLSELYDKHKRINSIPKVSIIIPVYNVENKYLTLCLDSAVRQTFLTYEYEIIIVNDASTDNSLATIKQYEKRYSNVTVVDKKVNQGLGAARNTGIEVARGEYVFFLDGDDFISVTTIDRLYTEAFLNNADIVPCSHAKVSVENGYKVLSIRSDLSTMPSNKFLRLKRILLHEHISAAWGILIKRDLLIINNIRFQTGYHEDISFFLKAFTIANNVIIYDFPLYNYVQRQNSILTYISKKHIAGALEAQIEKWNFINTYFGKETASRHFERGQTIQYGSARFINFLIGSIENKQPSYNLRSNLYHYLYRYICNIEFLSNSRVLYDKKFKRLFLFWKIFTDKRFSNTEKVLLYEYFKKFNFDNNVVFNLSSLHELDVTLNGANEKISFDIQDNYYDYQYLCAEIYFFEIKDNNNLICILKKANVIDKSTDQTIKKIDKSSNFFNIRHKTINSNKDFSLVIKNLSDKPVHFRMAIPIFIYNNKNNKINRLPTTGIPHYYFHFLNLFVNTIQTIIDHDNRYRKIFTEDFLNRICKDTTLVNHLLKDNKLVCSLEGNILINEICTAGILKTIANNSKIFSKLKSYDVEQGIINIENIIKKICEKKLITKIFGCEYNMMNCSDKNYGFFGKLIGAYEVYRTVKMYDHIDQPKLAGLKDIHKGKRGFIICNGPSLRNVDFQNLKNEITIGTNGLFLLFKEKSFIPNYYVVEDDLIAEDRNEDINIIQGPIKFFSQRLAYCLYRDENSIFLKHNYNEYHWDQLKQKLNLSMDFSPDISTATYGGNTVTYTCFQIAFHLGLTEIYIIGADHKYNVPKRYNLKDINENFIIESLEHDVNHFHSDYFGKGYRWHNPKVHKIEEAYLNAKTFFEHHDRKIYNATSGGHLEIFDRIDFNQLFIDHENRNFSNSPILINHVNTKDQLCNIDLNTQTKNNHYQLSFNCVKKNISKQPLFILGNGPSLRDFNFDLLNDSHWVGMNAAYRHWHRIKLYPTYYICLDTVVIESHKNEIYKLIINRAKNGIKLFFLRNCLLQSYPDLLTIPEVIFFEDYYKSPFFFNITEFLTTGSFSVLFGAMLGFKLIYLLGIDLGYVNMPETMNLKGDILKMTKTPKNNPNYFFDDYQLKGDLFNVPDSTPDLHQKSWRIVKERVENLGFSIFNCNKSSNLQIFDFADLNEILTSYYN